MPRKNPKNPTTRADRKSKLIPKTNLDEIMDDLPQEFDDDHGQTDREEQPLPIKAPKWKPLVVKGTKEFNDYMSLIISNRGKEDIVQGQLTPTERKHLITFAAGMLVNFTMSRKSVQEELQLCGLGERQSIDIVREAHEWVAHLYKEQVETMRSLRLAQMTHLEETAYREGRFNMALRLTKEINKVMGLYTENISVDITHRVPSTINLIEVTEHQDAEIVKEDEQDSQAEFPVD